MKQLLRSPRLLVALAASAAIIAGCGGGGQSITPSTSTNSQQQQPSSSGTTQRTGTASHRIYFYSQTYYKQHPELRALVTSSNNLIYNGGPVQLQPKIYLVFWGWSSANDTTQDPDGMASYLVNYVTAYGGSNLANVATQYYQTLNGTQYITNYNPEYGGAFYDSSLPPQNYTDANVQSEATKAISHFGYSANANYFVVTPTGYTTSGFGSQWCAYHNSYSSPSGVTAYTDFPYIPDAGTGCGQGSVNSPGTLDGASIVGGHEMTETITDPGAGNGWLDSSGSEIGDKCAWTNLQNVVMYGGATFPNQPEWGNDIAGCEYSYGTVASPSPSPSPTLTPTPTPQPSNSPTPSPKPSNSPTPSPIPSPTPTPSGSCSGQLFINPGFESGQTGWSSTAGVINTDGAYSYQGYGYAWLDGYSAPHTDTLAQTVTIKAGCHATISYELMIQTNEPYSTAVDTLKLTANGTVIQTFSNLNPMNYTLESVDVSAYAGQSVKFQWTGKETTYYNTSFFIDNTGVTLH